MTVKQILHFSDVHLNISATLVGDDSNQMRYHYGEDAPLALLESALTYAKQVLPEPSLFLYTGDHVAHDDMSRAVQVNVETMEKYYSPTDSKTLDVTAILGNNDANPNYYMELTDPDSVANSTIKKVSEAWKDSLSAFDFTAFNRRGYLSYSLDEKLLVITLNMIPYAPKHAPVTADVKDPFEQFAWLNATLLSLQKQDKFAYITGHIPPIVDSFVKEPQWQVSYIDTYKSIAGQFADVIKAQFFGHVQSIEQHKRSPRSAAPLGLHLSLLQEQPSFTVWDYDVETYDILDFTVYGTNISEEDQELNWKPIFKGREAYTLSSLSTDGLVDFYNRIKGDPTLLDEYYWNSWAKSTRQKLCESDACRAEALCSMKW
uniref:Calcineurin-like phosphoesterase domain-containing protein n=1 Tax=Globisporangium ultimum (strain ATCC 200006 / CBS 805.95 / DAOM BR144) TaxID=431595 RepID=K3WU47_GLOUD